MVIALIACFSGVSVYAKETSDSGTSLKASEPSAKSGHSANEAKANEKVKADVLKLVADARAGKLKSPPPQFPARTKRNNLSKGAKIGIVAAIAGAIFLIVMVQQLNSDDD